MRHLSRLGLTRRFCSAIVALGVAFGVSAGVSAAQTSEQTLYRTRAYLDSVATGMERSGKKDEAAAVRDRLKTGDFYPGDRLVVELYGGEEPFRDTVSVRAGQEVVIQSFPAFTLRGVLRSESDSALTAQVKRYIQRPTVRTQPLVRLLVTGAVGRPGFVTLRGDAAASDVVSAAGGLSGQARLPKSSIKRGTEKLLTGDSLAIVFRTGMTLDQTDIRAGDEFAFAEKKQGNVTQLLWGFSVAMSVVLTLVSLVR